MDESTGLLLASFALFLTSLYFHQKDKPINPLDSYYGYGSRPPTAQSPHCPQDGDGPRVYKDTHGREVSPYIQVDDEGLVPNPVIKTVNCGGATFNL